MATRQRTGIPYKTKRNRPLRGPVIFITNIHITTEHCPLKGIESTTYVENYV